MCVYCSTFFISFYKFRSTFSYRLVKLLTEIMQERENKTIIFVETKRKVDDISRRMKRDG